MAAVKVTCLSLHTQALASKQERIWLVEFIKGPFHARGRCLALTFLLCGHGVQEDDLNCGSCDLLTPFHDVLWPERLTSLLDVFKTLLMN